MRSAVGSAASIVCVRWMSSIAVKRYFAAPGTFLNSNDGGYMNIHDAPFQNGWPFTPAGRTGFATSSATRRASAALSTTCASDSNVTFFMPCGHQPCVQPWHQVIFFLPLRLLYTIARPAGGHV